jgi:hypothetical protein
MLSVGAFVEGELYLSLMQIFPSPLLPLFFSFIFFFFFFFFYSRANQRTLPCHGDQS